MSFQSQDLRESILDLFFSTGIHGRSLFSHVSRTKENTAAAAIELTAEQFESVNKVLADHPVQGSRYRPGTDEENHLWG